MYIQAVVIRYLELRRTLYRNCPKRGLSDAPKVDLAALGRAKWVEKGLLGGPWG